MVTDSSYEINHIEKGTPGQPVIRDDRVFLEWYEVRKSIHRCTTENGQRIVIVRERSVLIEENDILVGTNGYRIQVCIKPSECLVVELSDLAEAGLLAFMIGNFHVPIFSDNISKIYLAYDPRIHSLLKKMNHQATIETMKLLAVNQVRLL
jgi:urease accessory protein